MNLKKNTQLEENFSTASHKLKKSIMFSLIKRLGENKCYRCGEVIERVEDLSIDHKESWLNSSNPKELFFSLDNIAFHTLIAI